MLVDDAHDNIIYDDRIPIGPGVQEFEDLWINLLRSQGADPSLGGRLEGILNGSGCFGEVHAKKIKIPYAGQGAGSLANICFASRFEFCCRSGCIASRKSFKGRLQAPRSRAFVEVCFCRSDPRALPEGRRV